MAERVAACHFCGAPAPARTMLLSNDQPRPRSTTGPAQVPAILCARHRVLLLQAGARGRVHTRTGIRLTPRKVMLDTGVLFGWQMTS